MTYEKYKKSKYWKLIDKELTALEKNQDIKITTKREYVIGAIVKTITDTKINKADSQNKLNLCGT
jgi:hypothetical protein